MNDADLELLKAEAFAATARHDAAMASAIVRIQHDLAVMLDKVNRIEEMLNPSGSDWNNDDNSELDDQPF